MARGKRTWYLGTLRYLSQMVSWGCHATQTVDGFSRYVQIVADLDGREVVLKLTPGEARAIGRQLISQAGRVDEMNFDHGNGWAYPNEQEWGIGE